MWSWIKQQRTKIKRRRRSDETKREPNIKKIFLFNFMLNMVTHESPLILFRVAFSISSVPFFILSHHFSCYFLSVSAHVKLNGMKGKKEKKANLGVIHIRLCFVIPLFFYFHLPSLSKSQHSSQSHKKCWICLISFAFTRKEKPYKKLCCDK